MDFIIGLKIFYHNVYEEPYTDLCRYVDSSINTTIKTLKLARKTVIKYLRSKNLLTSTPRVYTVQSKCRCCK